MNCFGFKLGCHCHRCLACYLKTYPNPCSYGPPRGPASDGR
jgi:hypothetical protein